VKKIIGLNKAKKINFPWKNGRTDMTFNNAKRLRNEDEVTIKETGEIVTVLQAYSSENGKYIILECDDGNTYYNDEIR